jgi:hypothetical protein
MLRSDLAPSTAAPRRRRCSAARGLSPAGQLPGREPRTNGQTAASQRSSGATVRAYVPARHRRAGPGILRLHRARGKIPAGQTLPGGDGRVAADWRGSLSVIRSQGRVEPGSPTRRREELCPASPGLHPDRAVMGVLGIFGRLAQAKVDPGSCQLPIFPCAAGWSGRSGPCYAGWKPRVLT